MSYVPSDLTSRVGQEVTFGDIFRSAWRMHQRHFWTTILFALVIFAICLPAVCLSACIPIVGRLALVVLVAMPLMASLSWSVVCTYDGRRMELTDLFYGWRTRFGPLAIIGLIQEAINLIPALFYMALFGFAVMLPAMTGGRPATGASVAANFFQMGQVLFALLVSIAFYLAPLFTFTREKPNAIECIKDNWRVLKNRTGHFLATLFTPMAMFFGVGIIIVPLVIGGIFLMASKGGPSALGIVLIIAGALIGFVVGIWIYVFGVFLQAAFFRSACGYTLSQPESPYSDPGAPAAQAISPVPSTQPPGTFTVAPSDQQTFAPPEGPDSMQIDPQPEPPQQPPEQEPPEGSW